MLSQDDLIRLDNYRLERYQACHPVLQQVGLALSADRRLLLISPPEICEQVRAKLSKLKSDAWLILGAKEISLYRGNDLLLVEPTVKSPDKMSDNSPLGKTNMAVATQERKPKTPRTNSRSTQPPQPKLMLPTVRGLEILAQNTNTPAEAIATQICDLGHFAGFDLVTSSYLADEAGIDAWLDKWLEDDRAKRKTALLSPPSTKTPPSAEKSVKPKVAKSPTTLQRKTTTTSTRKTFRDFKKSSKYARTLGNFLDAQNWADKIRIEVVEGIAALSALPQEPNTLPERALAKIASKYPKAMQANAAGGMIAAAKEIMGLKQPE